MDEKNYKLTFKLVDGTEQSLAFALPKGDKGDKGDRGERGPQGIQGEKGEKGADGTMTFADLTEEQKESLRGAKGDKGDKGDQGEQGIQGPQGIQGIQGEKGDKGDKGDKGEDPDVSIFATHADVQEAVGDVNGYTDDGLTRILSEAKSYTDTELAEFDFIKVVNSLPTTGLPNRIYLVPKSDTQTQDLFDEYVWVNNKWEWMTTKQIEVDLTNYAKTTGSYANMSVGGLTSTLSVSNGGTGKTTNTSNAVLTGNGTGAVKNVTTASGAFYATSTNGAGKFGTLPIAQGGTGATNATTALSNLGAAPSSHSHPFDDSLTINAVYPVGSIYLSMGVDPNQVFPGTTWEQISQGRMLIGVGANQANTTTTHGSMSASTLNITSSGVMGGEVKHQLSVDEMPSHNHRLRLWNYYSASQGTNGHIKPASTINNADGNSSGGSSDPAYAIENAGGGASHNNMPPYFSVNIWKRTA